MRRALRGSFTQTVVSLATAAVAISVGAGRCAAGDKIQFTVPGDPAIAQKPEHDTKIDDTPAPEKLNMGAPTGGDFIPQAEPTTVIIHNNRDRDKRDKLRAWDSGIKPFGPDGNDDLATANAKPTANTAYTNSFDTKREWSAGSTLQRLTTHTDTSSDFSASHSPGQQIQGQSQSPYRNGVDLFSSLKAQDTDSQNTTDQDKKSGTSGLSAWDKNIGSVRESYSARMEEYSAMYNTSAQNRGGSDTTAKSTSSPTPGVGDGSLLTSQGDAETFGAHRSAQNDLRSLETLGSQQASAYGASRFNEPLNFTGQNQTQTRPTLNQPANGFHPTAAQPAHLPWPKQPGAIFQ